LKWSEIKIFPRESTATPCGKFSGPSSAATPSIALPIAPFPATVVITPSGATRRTRWFTISAINTFPSRSIATCRGVFNDASFAGPPSPENPGRPFPATTNKTPSARTRITMLLSVSQKYGSFVSGCTAIDIVNPNGACTAARPSPSNTYPVPTTVLMVCPNPTTTARSEQNKNLIGTLFLHGRTAHHIATEGPLRAS
jgi:hypothetical protein